MDPSTGQKKASSWVSVLLNIAGVDANLQKKIQNCQLVMPFKTISKWKFYIRLNMASHHKMY